MAISTTIKQKRRSRVRTLEGELILSSLESTKAAINKKLIVGGRLFKKMEGWASSFQEGPAQNSLVHKDLFRTGVYSPRENITTWDHLNSKEIEEVVSRFLEEGAGSVEERDQNHKAWLQDQSAWVKKVIRSLREEGPYYGAGTLCKWPSGRDIGSFRNPGLLPVFTEDKWESLINEIRMGEISFDIKKLRTAFPSSSTYSWYPHREYIPEESPFLSLGEWIIVGETKENLFFLRAAKFLAPIVSGDHVSDMFRNYNAQLTVGGARKKKRKELIGAAKTKPVFVLWNAFSGMPKLPSIAGRCGARDAVGGFPTIIRKPTQITKEDKAARLKFIFPTDNKDGVKKEHELVTRLSKLIGNRDQTFIKTTVLAYCKDFLLSLDEGIIDSWRRESGDNPSG